MANVTFDLIGNPVIVPPLGLDGSSGIKYSLNLPSDVKGSITIQGNFFTQRPAVGQSVTLVKMGPINLQVTTTAATANTNGNYIYLVKYTITQDSIDYTGYYANPTSYPNPTGLFYVNSYVDPLYPYTDLAFVNIVLQRSDVSTQAWRLWINGDPTDWPTTPYGDDVLGQEIFVGCSGQQEESISNVAVTGTAGQFSCTSAALTVGTMIDITGTLTGTATISTYPATTTYYVIATNGSTTFTLSIAVGGSAVATTAGTTTGLTFEIITGTNAYLGQCSDLWISDTDRYEAGDGQGIDVLTPVVDGFTLLYTPYTTGFGNE